MAEQTDKTQTAQTVQQVFVPPAPQFQRDDAQDEWIALEEERAEETDAAENQDIWARAAAAQIVFINSPQENDQYIGKSPTNEELSARGVARGSLRIVPLGPEALQPGRKVVWEDGTVSVLRAGVTDPAQILHPETGVPLIPAAEGESATEPTPGEVEGGTRTAAKAGAKKAASKK